MNICVMCHTITQQQIYSTGLHDTCNTINNRTIEINTMKLLCYVQMFFFAKKTKVTPSITHTRTKQHILLLRYIRICICIYHIEVGMAQWQRTVI